MSLFPIVAPVTSAFLPTDITGLQAWYKADAGITKDGGDQVSAWVDQSGNSLDLAQGTAADQPTWIDSRTNGLPAVHFDGTEHIDGATFASAITQPAHTFALVKKHSNTTGDRLIVTVPDGTTGPIYRDAGSGNISASNHIADGAVVNAGTSLYRLVSIVWNGTSTTNQLNVDTPATSATNISGNLVEVSLGGYSNGGNESDVDIAEYLVYDDEITSTDLTNLQDYFKDRYALWA
jgi:hypothetical protein